jgi:hypothetical protein
MNIKVKNEKLKSIIQNLIDSSLNMVREESEDWGLGEMDESDEVNSVNKIVINRITTVDKIKVYIDIYNNSYRWDFDNIRAEIQYRIGGWMPNVELYINEIIDDTNFNPTFEH